MDMQNYCSDILIGLSGGLFAGLGIWLLDFFKEKYLFCRDEKRILKFFKDHENDDYEFRKTFRIASEVNLTENRVIYICSNSEKIKRNEKKEETWELRLK
jgi:hypothetical protein